MRRCGGVASVLAPSLAHDLEQLEEEVGDVEVDRDGAVHRVIQGSRQLYRAVPVVDDIQGEQQCSRVVDEGPVVEVVAHSEAGRDELSEANEDEHGERTEQVAPPAQEERGEGDSDDAHDHGHSCGGHECVHDHGALVQVDRGAHDGTQAADHHQVAHQAHQPVVAAHRDEDADDRDDQAHPQRGPDVGLPGHGEEGDTGGDNEPHHREARDREDVLAEAELRTDASLFRTFPNHAGKTHLTLHFYREFICPKWT